MSDSQVKKLVETGQVGFPQIEQAFIAMTSQGGQFAGMMEAQSRTTTGMFSTLKDTGGSIAPRGQAWRIGKGLVRLIQRTAIGNTLLADGCLLASAAESLADDGPVVSELVEHVFFHASVE